MEKNNSDDMATWNWNFQASVRLLAAVMARFVHPYVMRTVCAREMLRLWLKNAQAVETGAFSFLLILLVVVLKSTYL
jgi:hypothetical protein